MYSSKSKTSISNTTLFIFATVSIIPLMLTGWVLEFQVVT